MPFLSDALNVKADMDDESFSGFSYCLSHPALRLISVDVQYFISSILDETTQGIYLSDLFVRAAMMAGSSDSWYTQEFPRIFQASRSGSL